MNNEFLKEMKSKTKMIFTFALNLIDCLHTNNGKVNIQGEELTPASEVALGFFLAGIKYDKELKELFGKYGITFKNCSKSLSEHFCYGYDISPMDKTKTYNTYNFNVLKDDFAKKLKERLMMEDGSLKISDIEYYQIFYYIVSSNKNRIQILLSNLGFDMWDELYSNLNKLVLKNDILFINNIGKGEYKNICFDNCTLYLYDSGMITLKMNDNKSVDVIDNATLILPNEYEIVSINGTSPDKSNIASLIDSATLKPNISLLLRDTESNEVYDFSCETSKFFSDTKEENINETPTPYLEKYGTELTKASFLKDPSVGRDTELKKVEQVLLYPEKDKSVIIVGPAGSGKTALVRGLAYRVQKGDVPRALKDIRIFSISVSSLVAGTKYVGTLEEKMRNILNEASKDKNIILFIDEIHQAIGGGKSEGNNNTVSEILKPYIDYGDVRIIGATTIDEYNEFIQSDEAFKTRLKKIPIDEPSEDVIYDILDDLITKYDEISFSKLSLDEYDKDMVIKWLIEATNKKYRTYNDRASNPRLVLDIIKEAYAIAAINDREKVTYEDLCEALMDESRLYESSKLNQVNKLRSASPNKGVSRIIKFEIKKREN